MELRERFPELRGLPLLRDVRERAQIDAVIAAEQPEIVFHAAALKHLPMVEANPIEGVLTNVVGSRNVAEAARAFGVSLVVMISTDKAVNPTSVMGATKRARRKLLPGARSDEARRARPPRHALCHGAVRQRARLDRIGGAAVRAPARRRRAADRHRSRGHALFHDRARGGRAGAAGLRPVAGAGERARRAARSSSSTWASRSGSSIWRGR